MASGEDFTVTTKGNHTVTFPDADGTLYQKPSGGIPASDLASGVIDSQYVAYGETDWDKILAAKFCIKDDSVYTRSYYDNTFLVVFVMLYYDDMEGVTYYRTVRAMLVDSDVEWSVSNVPHSLFGTTVLSTDNESRQEPTEDVINGVDRTIRLHCISKTGNYNDLLNKPTIPSAPGTLSTTATTSQSTSASESLSGSITLHKVAKTGSYSDLNGTPTIPTVESLTQNEIDTIWTNAL